MITGVRWSTAQLALQNEELGKRLLNVNEGRRPKGLGVLITLCPAGRRPKRLGVLITLITLYPVGRRPKGLGVLVLQAGILRDLMS